MWEAQAWLARQGIVSPELGQVGVEEAAESPAGAFGREPEEPVGASIQASVPVSTLERWLAGWAAALAEEPLVPYARVAQQPARRPPAHGVLRDIG